MSNISQNRNHKHQNTTSSQSGDKMADTCINKLVSSPLGCVIVYLMMSYIRDFPYEMSHQISIVYKSYDSRMIISANHNRHNFASQL